uniref:Uncharacterized protein n=1 Tax=Rangifer tarandus platyrhynchus TaxID=3082113 RepID=A0ACB0E661_RANTA|nr:unnamed protein product [Rangifer tarandus platyrhynchus]
MVDPSTFGSPQNMGLSPSFSSPPTLPSWAPRSQLLAFRLLVLPGRWTLGARRPPGGVPEEPESSSEERREEICDVKSSSEHESTGGLGEDRECAQQECHGGAQPGVRAAAAGPGDLEAQAAPPPPITAPDRKSESTPGPPPSPGSPASRAPSPKGFAPTTLLSTG